MMSVPATWGLTSLQFLAVYGALCVLLRWANILAWSAVERRAAASQPRPVDAYGLAMLNGGPRQAIATALTVLEWRGVLREGPLPGWVGVEGGLDRDADPLERAVHADVRRRGAIDPAALCHEPATCDALERITTDLTHAGLLIDARHSTWTGRLWVWGPIAIFALGTVRLLVMWRYVDADTNMRLLLFATLGVGCVAVSHVIDQSRYDKRPLPSARGRSLVEEWRTKDRDSIGSERERVARVAALADHEEWEPGRAAAAPAVQDGPLLLPEEFVLLECAKGNAPDPTLGVRVSAALLIELGMSDHIDVRTTPGGATVVALLDDGPTGDALLDEALSLLGGRSEVPASAAAPAPLWSFPSRRRLRGVTW